MAKKYSVTQLALELASLFNKSDLELMADELLGKHKAAVGGDSIQEYAINLIFAVKRRSHINNLVSLARRNHSKFPTDNLLSSEENLDIDLSSNLEKFNMLVIQKIATTLISTLAHSTTDFFDVNLGRNTSIRCFIDPIAREDSSQIQAFRGDLELLDTYTQVLQCHEQNQAIAPVGPIAFPVLIQQIKDKINSTEQVIRERLSLLINRTQTI